MKCDLEAEAVGKGRDQVVVEAAGAVALALEKGRRFADRHHQRPSASGGSMRLQAAGTAEAGSRAGAAASTTLSLRAVTDEALRGYNPRLAERWQSGRMYLTRNQAMSQGIRGFESHPLRQQRKLSPCLYGLFCFYRIADYQCNYQNVTRLAGCRRPASADFLHFAKQIQRAHSAVTPSRVTSF
jgi:hypothetical protein